MWRWRQRCQGSLTDSRYFSSMEFVKTVVAITTQIMFIDVQQSLENIWKYITEHSFLHCKFHYKNLYTPENAYFQSIWRIYDHHFFLPSQEIQKRRKIQNFDILAVCNWNLLHCCCSFSLHSSWLWYFLFAFWFWITLFLDNKFIPTVNDSLLMSHLWQSMSHELILSERLLWDEIQNCRQK